MATPNYGYEKRQKELAKKRKKEEKLRAKSKGPDTRAEGLPGQPGDQPVTGSGDAPIDPAQP